MKQLTLLISVLVYNLSWSQSIERITLSNTQDYFAGIIRLPSQSYLMTKYAKTYGPYYESSCLLSREGFVVSENSLGMYDRVYTTNLLNGPNGAVYSGNNSSDYAGVYQARVRKLNPNGTLAWQVNTSDSDYSVGTPIITCDNTIFIGVSEKSVIDYQPDQPFTHFIARISSTGTVVWKYYLQDTTIAYLGLIRELDSNHIIMTAYDSNLKRILICVTKDGNAVWEKSYPSIPTGGFMSETVETNNGITKLSTVKSSYSITSPSLITYYLINNSGDLIHYQSYSIPFANIVALVPKSQDSYLIIATNTEYYSFDFYPSDTICSILTTDTSGNILTQFALPNTSYTQPMVNDVYFFDSNKISLWATLANGSEFAVETTYQNEIIEIDLSGMASDTKTNAQNIITTPNPTGRNITINIFEDAVPGSIIVTDVQGNIITKLSVYSGEVTFTLEDAPEGLYFIHYESEDGKYRTTMKALVTDH